jgi:NAD(P)H-hydrate epimerase
MFINTSGTPALATGGSGDVLCGVIAAVLCQSDNPVAAVRLAVFVHGLAAELSPNGMRGTTADDQPQLIAQALQQLSPLA